MEKVTTIASQNIFIHLLLLLLSNLHPLMFVLRNISHFPQSSWFSGATIKSSYFERRLSCTSTRHSVWCPGYFTSVHFLSAIR